MAKGISAVIATIMLLLITIALIGVVYAFITTLAGTTIAAGTGQASATTDRMLKTITVSAATCGNTTPANNIINFTVQNIGTKDILPGELAVYVDGAKADGLTVINNSALNSGLAANAQAYAGVQTASYSKTRTLKVQSPANPSEISLTC